METSPTPQEPEQQPEADTVIVDLTGRLKSGEPSTVVYPDGTIIVSDDDE